MLQFKCTWARTKHEVVWASFKLGAREPPMHTIYCIEITCCKIWNLETTIENKHQKYNPLISIPNHKGWKANLSINIPTRVQGKHKYRFWSSKTLTSSNLPLENLVKSIHRNATKCLTSYSKQNKIKPKWSDSHTSNVTNHTHGFSHTHTHTHIRSHPPKGWHYSLQCIMDYNHDKLKDNKLTFMSITLVNKGEGFHAQKIQGHHLPILLHSANLPLCLHAWKF